jgi:glycerol-3-phosphate dehydrogenase
VRDEMAMKLDDVLARRIRILFLDAKAAVEMAPAVAKIMAKELKEDQHWIDKQLTDFNRLALRYLIN